MRTETPGYSIVDAVRFERPVPPDRAGIDVARAPGFVWLRGEIDEHETLADFLARAQREARDAGFRCVEISGHVDTEE